VGESDTPLKTSIAQRLPVFLKAFGAYAPSQMLAALDRVHLPRRTLSMTKPNPFNEKTTRKFVRVSVYTRNVDSVMMVAGMLARPGTRIAYGRVFMINTRAQRKLQHTWIM
jgi:hypothetical protein